MVNSGDSPGFIWHPQNAYETTLQGDVTLIASVLPSATVVKTKVNVQLSWSIVKPLNLLAIHNNN